jgi:hypothetical protein
MVRHKTRRKVGSRGARARHAEGMITTIGRPARRSSVPPVSRASCAEPNAAARNLAYRRLVAVALGLDVASLAASLRSERLAGHEVPRAA